jgi:hypothetical protein
MKIDHDQQKKKQTYQKKCDHIVRETVFFKNVKGVKTINFKTIVQIETKKNDQSIADCLYQRK